MQINNKVIFILTIAMVALQFINPATASAFCNTNADCGGTVIVGVQSCMGNGVYQDYITNTCINPGTSNSSCFTTRNSQLVQACQNQCNSGVCTSGTTNNSGTTQYTCISHSYERCVGNAVYWFNSCNAKQGLVTTCSDNQMCQGNACFNNATQTPAPTAHFTKICSDNSIYWFDSNGVRQEIYQQCIGNQLCQNSQCVITQKNATVQPTVQTNQNIDQGASNSTAAVSGSPMLDFLKKWWVWILVVFIITVLFVVIFRRLSKDA